MTEAGVQMRASDIKQYARSLGFDACGIAPAAAHPELAFFREWLSRGYAGEMAYFIDCVRTGRKPTRVTAEDAVVGLRIVEAEKRSVETGQPVAV